MLVKFGRLKGSMWIDMRIQSRLGTGKMRCLRLRKVRRVLSQARGHVFGHVTGI